MARMGRRVLSTTAEHALRAVLHLAARGSRDLLPAAEVARALGTPPNYTGKTLRVLSRKGILVSVRGPAGGFALRVDPSRLSVADVVEAVDEPPVGTPVCLLGDRPCDADHPCEAHARWSALVEEAGALLEKTTIADLLGDPEEPGPDMGEWPSNEVIFR